MWWVDVQQKLYASVWGPNVLFLLFSNDYKLPASVDRSPPSDKFNRLLFTNDCNAI